MTVSRKKDMVREYRERKIHPGIFAVRCSVLNRNWIGVSRDLDSQQNGIWFQLRMGNHMNRDLQSSWNSHGAEAFQFEILEIVENENPEMIGLLLKEREMHWREATGGAKLFA
jgi:hypothetical protein